MLKLKSLITNLAGAISRLGWIWLSAAVIVVILVCAALWHYPVWHTDEMVSETSSVLGFDDTPGTYPDMSADSIMAIALGARMYSHGIVLSDQSAASSEQRPEQSPTEAAEDIEAPALDPYLDTPEE